MYNELYGAWRREVDEASLGALQPDFYVKITEYISRVKEEDKVIDKKSVKINLLEHEAQNVERMLAELLLARYKKIVKLITKTQKVPVELLTVEEAKICETFADFSFAYQKFSKNLMQGEPTQFAAKTEPIRVVIRSESPIGQPRVEAMHKRLTLRFTKSIPAIMGADMKSYGPFAVEDIASLPAENAKILVKQGLAVLVEVS
jgi:DNA replication initiation complex subunit (GINS family)